jgi:hypothetical protein
MTYSIMLNQLLHCKLDDTPRVAADFFKGPIKDGHEKGENKMKIHNVLLHPS